ncbi:3-hydroxybenzoate 6-monooxygenase [Bradyrhizobium sp. Ai1a-2]|uniref:3-hydroxybenzoate 6-monooxygenase n=1 Tax=Bradyrhizobium sp. Ai1a-2 TaxID=196490 RepID=UPI001FCB4FF2|nr:3-hydroxybenzoate 6-monooxygenase [Bradyrhizobium sp. Ai1a-2]
MIRREAPILIVGGGIGGLAAALALAHEGRHVKILEQASAIEEIGAGLQLGPNALAAFDALGVGERVRSHMTYPDRLVMLDAVDGKPIADVPVGTAFRRRFGNPYALGHRADMHMALLESVQAVGRVDLVTSMRIVEVEQTTRGVTAIDADGGHHDGIALIGCDGVKSAVRQRLIGDAPRVSGDVVYRAMIEAGDFPVELQGNAPVVWAGPNCHLVHYPLRDQKQYNLVVTFHSERQEAWGVTEGSQEEILSHFVGIDRRPHQLLSLLNSGKRWATADREPLDRWSSGHVTLLGDAAHPMLQYLGQGACMTLEDAVTLGAAIRIHPDDLPQAFGLYERSRIARTARAVLSAREFGRLIHAKGMERIVRNELWKGRTPERFYDALEWLYGWRADACLAA